MQFLTITPQTTLASLSSQVGRQNVDEILTANELPRTPKVGQAYVSRCNDILKTASPVTAVQKINMLNTLTSDSEIFETAAMMTEDEWKIFQKLGTLPSALSVPTTIKLQKSSDIIGNSLTGIATHIYQRTINSLNATGRVDSTIFNTISSIKHPPHNGSPRRDKRNHTSGADVIPFSGFNLPWGKIRLYSSLTDDSVDIPVYPEEISDGAKASYTTMPDLLYQYEPWYAYTGSGPRSVEYSFHMHRDMWTGDHRDGNANALIRFAESCCYAEYNGSAVNTTLVTLYINGDATITGIMTDENVRWSGPIGLDGWYLEFTLSFTITEVSKIPKNITSVRAKNVIGG